MVYTFWIILVFIGLYKIVCAKRALDRNERRKMDLCQMNVVTSQEVKEALKDSDDICLFEKEFLKAATFLIKRRVLTLEDFKFNGGWVRAARTSEKKPLYFVFPKHNADLSNKINLDVSTGSIYYFRGNEDIEGKAIKFIHIGETEVKNG